MCMCVQVPQWPVISDLPGSEVTGGGKPLDISTGYQSWGPLEEQQALLTIEPPLQP